MADLEIGDISDGELSFRPARRVHLTRANVLSPFFPIDVAAALLTLSGLRIWVGGGGEKESGEPLGVTHHEFIVRDPI